MSGARQVVRSFAFCHRRQQRTWGAPVPFHRLRHRLYHFVISAVGGGRGRRLIEPPLPEGVQTWRRGRFHYRRTVSPIQIFLPCVTKDLCHGESFETLSVLGHQWTCIVSEEKFRNKALHLWGKDRRQSYLGSPATGRWKGLQHGVTRFSNKNRAKFEFHRKNKKNCKYVISQW